MTFFAFRSDPPKAPPRPVKDQSRLPPSLSPAAPQLPTLDSERPVLPTGQFEK